MIKFQGLLSLLLLSCCDPLQFFFWEFSAMSKQQSRSLRDITLSARHGQYQGWIVAVIIIIKNYYYYYYYYYYYVHSL